MKNSTVNAHMLAELIFENQIPFVEVEAEYDVLTKKDEIDDRMEEMGIPKDCWDDTRNEVINKLYLNSGRSVSECVNEAYQELYIDNER